MGNWKDPLPLPKEIIQILINICLWLQVMAFWGKVIPCLSLPWSWLDILKPMEQVVKLARANVFCVQLWGRGMKQKGKLRYIKSTRAQQKENLWIKTAELTDFRRWSIASIWSFPSPNQFMLPLPLPSTSFDQASYPVWKPKFWWPSLCSNIFCCWAG